MRGRAAGIRAGLAALVACAAGSAALTFSAAAQPAPVAREVRLNFLGDGGSGTADQRAVRDQMLKHPAPLVFLLGDNIYDRGDRTLFESRFDSVYSPVMAQGSAFHAALGNHDVAPCNAASRNPLPDDAEAYRWGLLRCDVKAQLTHAPFGYVNGHRYYEVVTDASPAPLGEVFVLDSNTLHSTQSKLSPLQEDRAQIDWLDHALSVSRARWKIAIMHHPPESPSVGGRYFLFLIPFGEGRARELRLGRDLEPIFRRHGVDAVFAGHNHFYARMVPQDGIRYFVSGGAGRSIYPFKEDPRYVAAGGGFFHFVHVRLTDDRFEYSAIDSGGRVRDAGWWAKGDAADHPLPAGTESTKPR